MKAPIVALAATAAGFAAASAYLYGELSVERVRTQAEVEARSRHEARSKPLHQTIEWVADGPSAQASVLPFSQLKDTRFMPSPGEAPDLAKSPVSPDSLNAPDIALLTSSFTAENVSGAQAPTSIEQKGSEQKPADSKDWDPREERAPASRIARRLMRERNSLPEPPSH